MKDIISLLSKAASLISTAVLFFLQNFGQFSQKNMEIHYFIINNHLWFLNNKENRGGLTN
ncbi:MAG: hypothetical protein K5765_02390 [Clostridia bacterium]|nr:hypothetical protein [Clostridia bacterium]